MTLLVADDDHGEERYCLEVGRLIEAREKEYEVSDLCLCLMSLVELEMFCVKYLDPRNPCLRERRIAQYYYCTTNWYQNGGALDCASRWRDHHRCVVSVISDRL